MSQPRSRRGRVSDPRLTDFGADALAKPTSAEQRQQTTWRHHGPSAVRDDLLAADPIAGAVLRLGLSDELPGQRTARSTFRSTNEGRVVRSVREPVQDLALATIVSARSLLATRGNGGERDVVIRQSSSTIRAATRPKPSGPPRSSRSPRCLQARGSSGHNELSDLVQRQVNWLDRVEPERLIERLSVQ